MFKRLIRPLVIAGITALSLSAVTVANAASSIITQGTFTGASDHVTTGGISVVKTESGAILVLESDFSLDGAPDPKLGFGKDGKYDAKSKIAHLGKIKGLQVYKIPASVDPSKYNELYVWCEKFNVPLGVAKLK